MRHAVAPLALALAFACHPAQPGAQVAQLEAAEATHDAGDDREEAAARGVTAVSGSDRDWTLVVRDGAGDVTVGLHLPGGSDLSDLDGRALSVDLGAAWGDPTRVVVVADDDGPVLIVQPWPLGAATELFGDGFVSWGEDLGEGVVHDDYGDWTVRYRAARFETDDGPVEAVPGEPFEATVGGSRYRIVVHGAFEIVDTPDLLPGCGGGLGETLSFEMQRVERPPSLDRREALQGARMAGEGSCG